MRVATYLIPYQKSFSSRCVRPEMLSQFHFVVSRILRSPAPFFLFVPYHGEIRLDGQQRNIEKVFPQRWQKTFTLSINTQGGDYEIQGVDYEIQGGDYETQGEDYEIQGGYHERKGGDYEIQGDVIKIQGVYYEIQGKDFEYRVEIMKYRVGIMKYTG